MRDPSRDVPVTGSWLMRRTGYDRARLYNGLRLLKKEGKVYTEGSGPYTVYKEFGVVNTTELEHGDPA